jgi:hypothetical protein
MSGATTHSSPDEEAVRALLEPLRGASQQRLPSDLATRHVAAMVARGNEIAEAQDSRQSAVVGWRPSVVRYLRTQRRTLMSAGVATAACALFAVIAFGTASAPVRDSVDDLSVTESPALAATSAGPQRDSSTGSAASRTGSRSESTATNSSTAPAAKSYVAPRRARPTSTVDRTSQRPAKRGTAPRPQPAAGAPSDHRGTKPEPTSGKHDGSSTQTSSPVTDNGGDTVPEAGGGSGGSGDLQCPNPGDQPGTPDASHGDPEEPPVGTGEPDHGEVIAVPGVITGVEPETGCGGQP